MGSSKVNTLWVLAVEYCCCEIKVLDGTGWTTPFACEERGVEGVTFHDSQLETGYRPDDRLGQRTTTSVGEADLAPPRRVLWKGTTKLCQKR